MEKYTEQEQVRRNKLNFYIENNIAPFKKAYDLGKLVLSQEIVDKYSSFSREEL